MAYHIVYKPKTGGCNLFTHILVLQNLQLLILHIPASHITKNRHHTFNKDCTRRTAANTAYASHRA